MLGSETPFSSRFWREPLDARPLALFRIVMGLLMAFDLVDRMRNLNAFYTDGGVMPPSSIHEWTIFRWAHTEPTVIALFVIGIALALLVTAGLGTRIVTPLAWAFLMSLHHRNRLVMNGADDVLRLAFLWASFSDWGAVYSLDARRRAPRPTIAPLPVRLLQMQLGVIYFIACVIKFGGRWSDGSALYFALQTPGFIRPSAAWVLGWPGLLMVLTYATLVIEGLFPFFVFSPWRTERCRAVAMIAGVGLHVSILLLMRVGMFSPMMLAMYLPLVPGEWLDRIRWPRIAAAPDPLQPRPTPRWLAVVLLSHFAIGAVSTSPIPFDWAGGFWLRRYLAIIGLHENWRMFQQPQRDHSRWFASGLRTDGVLVAVLPEAAPEMLSDVGWVHSRWTKVRSVLTTAPTYLPGVGAYLCRRWQVAHPEQPLVRIDVFLTTWPILGPGETPTVGETTQQLLEQPCR